MKIVFLFITLMVQLLFVYVFGFKLIDEPWPFMFVFFGSLLPGLVIRFTKITNKKMIKSLGWGLLYGSLASLFLIIIFLIVRPMNFAT